MHDDTQVIYRTTVIGFCGRDFPEKPRKFNHIECIKCENMSIPKALTGLRALGGEVKKTDQS